MRTITVRLPNEAYDAVKQHADNDQVSMNAWIEALLDAEDMRRRCAAHEEYMRTHPEAQEFAQRWAEQYANELASR